MNDKEILKILKEKPFILQKLFGDTNGLLKNQLDYDNRCFWGTITKEEVNKVVAWLNEEELEDVNPSEALEGLKHIQKYYVPQPCSAKTYDYLEIIEQALLKAQEQEKALEDAVIIPIATLKHWFDLLCVNGCNSKGMVRNDIQEILKK